VITSSALSSFEMQLHVFIFKTMLRTFGKILKILSFISMDDIFWCVSKLILFCVRGYFKSSFMMAKPLRNLRACFVFHFTIACWKTSRFSKVINFK
jgi:hypothetical protein